MPIFEEIDNDEYERRKEARQNDDFIVDDDGFGYVDRGGEIWEYEDNQMYGQAKGKKQKKTNVKVSLHFTKIFHFKNHQDFFM